MNLSNQPENGEKKYTVDKPMLNANGCNLRQRLTCHSLHSAIRLISLSFFVKRKTKSSFDFIIPLSWASAQWQIEWMKIEEKTKPFIVYTFVCNVTRNARRRGVAMHRNHIEINSQTLFVCLFVSYNFLSLTFNVDTSFVVISQMAIPVVKRMRQFQTFSFCSKFYSLSHKNHTQTHTHTHAVRSLSAHLRNKSSTSLRLKFNQFLFTFRLVISVAACEPYVNEINPHTTGIFGRSGAA